MDRIALIVPYFGLVPPFYKAWETTALANDTIDFFVFTDDHSVEERENIHVKNITFAEFRAMIQSKFEFEISLETPYKLCDYKPTYGIVFEDLLKDYDWWGYCDIDLLLGDVRNFFTDYVLSEYERCQLLGHLCIYRNTDRMKTIFKYRENVYPGLNYEEVYQTEESMYFDEARGLLPKCLLNHVRSYCEESFCDPLQGERKFYHIQKDKENNYVVFWENGQLYRVERNGNRTELLYAHFFRRGFDVYPCSEEIRSIKVVPNQVVFNVDVTSEDFEKSEGFFYKILYKVRSAYKSVKRYGFRRTLERQKWSKEHDRYVGELRREFSRNEDTIKEYIKNQ